MRKLKNCFASGLVGSVLRCLDDFESLMQNGKYTATFEYFSLWDKYGGQYGNGM